MNTVSDRAAEEKVSILIVDDEPAIGDALKLVLESTGYDVVLVEKGREGIKKARSGHFHVGIIDLFLGDMSGLQAIKTIREQQPEILVILITGKGTPQAFSEAQRLGVVGILAKPFRPVDILQLITRALNRLE
jgi:two-component system response regulator AtoC